MRFCAQPYLLKFRVKFFVTEMSRLLEEYTRYHFYLQLRKDIVSGRLTGDESILATLASYVLQCRADLEKWFDLANRFDLTC